MKYDMWVRPHVYEGGQTVEGPTPVDASLNPDLLYLVLDVHDNGEMGSEAYFSVINEMGEVWFVSNRHFIVESLELNGIPMVAHREPFNERDVGWSGFSDE